jgi:hypothetical protein
MLISIILGAVLVAQVDRKEFSAIDVPSRALFDMLPVANATRISRIGGFTDMKPLLVKEASNLAAKFKDNDNKLRRRFTRNRLVDHFYSLPNVHGPLTDKEDDEIDSIVDTSCKPFDKIENQDVLRIDNGEKVERYTLIDGNRIKVLGWLEPGSTNISFNINEQTPEFQRIYTEWRAKPK